MKSSLLLRKQNTDIVSVMSVVSVNLPGNLTEIKKQLSDFTESVSCFLFIKLKLTVYPNNER